MKSNESHEFPSRSDTFFPLLSSDPCSDTLNSLSVACRVNPKTYKQFTFAPANSCPPDSTPICASDGHTYNSECQMERTALQNNLELKKVSLGSCKEKGEFLLKQRCHRLPGAHAHVW